MGGQLTRTELDYWNRYQQSLTNQPRPVEPRVTAGCAGTPEMTDLLLALYLSGKKTAGSSLVDDFLTAGDPLPRVGDFWICLDSEARPSCILTTVRVETHVFRDVPASIASAEGEGDGSVEQWRRLHVDRYGPFLSSWGIECIEDAEVITEFFTVVFRDPAETTLT